jgi:gas vesicle protein
MRRNELDDEPYIIIEKHSGGLGSFLVGLAVGAGVALLMAPQSGVETRTRLQRQARRAGERARTLADEVGETARGRWDDARGAVETRVERARSAVDLKREQVARAVEAGRVAATEAREDLERRIAQTKAAYHAAARPVGGSPLAVDPSAVAPGEFEGSTPRGHTGDADV